MKPYINHTSTFCKGKGLNRKGRGIMRKKIKWAAIAVGIIALLLIGNYIYSIVHTVNHFSAPKPNSPFKNVEPISASNPELAAPKWEGTQRVNILVLGGDSRGLASSGTEVPRSDSMMVVSIEPNTKKALLISILRDTYVKIPGHGQDRINAALAIGGPTLAMKTVSNLLDIPIQYFVYMDFKGFIGVVDALGSVPIDVEKDMDYTDGEDGHAYDIHLKKGLQDMNGKTALQYVRFRHDAQSDFARADRQRKFLTAISQQMQTTSGIIKLPQILSAVDPYIETNISFSEMLKLGSLGYDAKATGFVGIQVPPMHLLDETRINGADVLSTDTKLLQAYIQDKFVESLTGVEQPIESMKPSAIDRPISKPTTKPISTEKPKTDDPIIPAEPTASGDPAESQPPIESVKPSEAPIPTPKDAQTPKPTITPKLTTKPVIKAAE
jgi:LCP family protein required for cell wall assembly